MHYALLGPNLPRRLQKRKERERDFAGTVEIIPWWSELFYDLVGNVACLIILAMLSSVCVCSMFCIFIGFAVVKMNLFEIILFSLPWTANFDITLLETRSEYYNGLETLGS